MKIDPFSSSNPLSKSFDLLREARTMADGEDSKTVADLGNVRLSVLNARNTTVRLDSAPIDRALFVVEGTVRVDPSLENASLSRGELVVLPKGASCAATADPSAILMLIEAADPNDALDGQPGSEILSPIWI